MALTEIPEPTQAPRFLQNLAGIVKRLVKRVNVLSRMQGAYPLNVKITDGNATISFASGWTTSNYDVVVNGVITTQKFITGILGS